MPDSMQIVGQLLGHALGQRGHQRALVTPGALADLVHQVVDLALGRPDLNLRIEQAGGPDDLLHHLRECFSLVGAGRGRGVDRLVDVVLELLELQRAVVQGRGQAEAVVDQHFLARAVAVVHAADLRKGHVRLVDEHQEIVGEVVQQRPGRAPRRAPSQVAGVVLDTRAIARLPQHLQVVAGALLQALGLQQLILLLQLGQPLLQLLLDVFEGLHQLLLGRDEVLGRIDLDGLVLGQHLAGQGVQLHDALDLVAPELEPIGELAVGRIDLQGIAADAELAAR